MDNNILIIAGEPSGDIRAAELLSGLTRLLPEHRFWGIGGDRMAEQKADLVYHIRDFSLVGAIEILKGLPRTIRQFRKILNEASIRKPDLAILVDYPGFNLRMAEALHKKGIPVLYYIIPQVWAWGANRVNKIRDNVDKAFVLFDFEEDLLKTKGIPCVFTGHPLADRTEEISPLPDPGEPVTLGLLPGSRKNEIERLLPVMMETAEMVKDRLPETRYILAECSNVPRHMYDDVLRDHPEIKTSIIKDDTFKALKESDFAMVTSGTATLETAVTGTPFLVTYKASRLTHFFYQRLKKLPFLGLVNIISGKEIVPEFLQDNASPEEMAHFLVHLVHDKKTAEHIRKDLLQVRDRLGKPGVAQKAAEEMVKFMKTRNIL